jgi:hypothetical protein
MTKFAAVAARAVVAVVAVALAVGLLTGCGSKGADVKCNLNECTVTLDRGVDAKANVLGVDIKLVSVGNDQVTLDVGGNKVSIPTSGANGSADVGGLTVSVQQVTGDKVVLKVTKTAN